jgi:hypothetical protein
MSNSLYSKIINKIRNSFILSDDDLLLVADVWNRSRFRVESSVCILPLLLLLGRFEQVLLLVDVSWNLSMSGDSLDLRVCAELLLESLVVLEGVFLARAKLKIHRKSAEASKIEDHSTHRSKFLRRIRLPDANVHFIGAAVDVLVVQAPSDTRHMLLSLCVVDLAGIRLLDLVDSDCFVVASRDEFATGW